MPLIIHNHNYKIDSMPFLLDDILQLILNDKSKKYYLIVPTGKMSRKIKLDLVFNNFSHTTSPIKDPKVMTLNKFAEIFFNNLFADKNYRKISDAFSRVLFEEADELSNLQFFKGNNKKSNPVILDKLSNIILGLKEDGILPFNLEKDLENVHHSGISHIQKYQDIYELYKNYEIKLGDNLIDSKSILIKINQKLINSDYAKLINNIFDKDTVVIFYGFTEFRQPEIQFLSFFNNTNLDFAINFDFSSINGPLFGNLNEIISNFVSVGFLKYDTDIMYNQAAPDAQFDISDPHISPGKFLRRWLFNVEKEIRHPHFSNIIKIIEAENIEEECDAILKLIKHYNIEKNINLGEMCIVSRKPEVYASIFREKFRAENIPVNITDRFPLSKSPVIIAIFAMLDLYIRGFKREDLNRALNNPFLTIINSKTGNKIDGVNLYNTAVLLKVTGGFKLGGHKSWINRINNRISANLNRIKILIDDSLSYDLEIKGLISENELLEKALSDFESIISNIQIFKKEIDIDDFEKLIKQEIIKNFKIKENIIDYFKAINLETYIPGTVDYYNLIEIIQKDSNALWAFIKVFDEFISIYKERFKRKFSLSDLTKRLKTTVEASKYQIKEKVNYGVTVTSVEQIRGIDFKLMILCGTLDGVFPMAYRPESFLGKHLPDSEDRQLKSEQMVFYQFLTNNLKKSEKEEAFFYITYPQFDEDRDLVRSPYIDSLLKISKIEEDNKIFNLKNEKKEKNNQIQISWINEVSLNSEKQILDANIILNKYVNSNLNVISDSQTYLNHFLNFEIEHGKIIPNNNKAIEFLEKYISKTFSITEFENFKKCPHSHFSNRVLKIKTPDTMDLTLSPLEIGNFFHWIAFKFYSQLQNTGNDFDESIGIINSTKKELPAIYCVRLNPENRSDYLELINKIALEELSRIKYEHPFFEFEELELFGRENRKGIIENWLDAEIARFENGWDTSPGLFEFEFGSNRNNPFYINNNLKIRGKIDRIEFEKNDDSYRFKIADYKTNLKNTKNNYDIIKKESFQMPIYIYVTKQILSDYYDISAECIGGIYYGWKNIKNESHKYVLVNEDTVTSELNEGKRGSKQRLKLHSQDEIIDEIIKETKLIAENISNGHFQPNPSANNCRYCNFSSICRKDDNH